jgi:hypothetical protein
MIGGWKGGVIWVVGELIHKCIPAVPALSPAIHPYGKTLDGDEPEV